MASVSSSSSIGNTSLRGYGGMASGIDRDSIIEQMTLGTTTKIEKQEKKIEELGWKQEAYQNISDKILDLQDNYLSYTGKNIKDSSLYEKNQYTLLGDSDVTKYISVSGTSSLAENITVTGVAQLATSATCTSKSMTYSAIQTGTKWDDEVKVSNLANQMLTFVKYGTDDQIVGSFDFTFPTTYYEVEYDENGNYIYATDESGNKIEKDIDYTSDDAEEMVRVLNLALKQADLKTDVLNVSKALKFELDGDGKLQLAADDSTEYNLEEYGKLISNGYGISKSSSALEALGYNQTSSSKSISLDEFNAAVKSNAASFTDSCGKKNAMEYMAGKKFSITYGGVTKSITLLDKDDVLAYLNEGKSENDKLTKIDWNPTDPDKKEELKQAIEKAMQKSLNSAFGKDKIIASITTDGSLQFDTKDGLDEKKEGKLSLTIDCADSAVQSALGLSKGASTQISLKTSLEDNWSKIYGEKIVTDESGKIVTDKSGNPVTEPYTSDEINEILNTEGFTINGVKLEGVTKDTTINELLSKINNNKDMGVKATYLETEGTFALISTETGSGRTIELGGFAEKLFEGGKSTDGKDAIMLVNYGTGKESMITSSSNTFNLSGMKITVSGTFNTETTTDNQGNITSVKSVDSSQTVRFSAKADVDGVTETIKKFIEAYNEMVAEIQTQMTTKPDSDYGALTSDQKSEMSETSIENWEKKAKEGILYNDSTLRDLSSDLQSLMATLMMQGVSPNDLETIGITASDDYSDGGKLVFDESAFKAAMESDPDLVSNIICGGGGVSKGLAETLEDKLTTYATRYASKNGNSYGRLIEEAGSSKVPLSVSNNEIYRQLKEMNETLAALKERLSTEQDRYISQFTTMETLINKYNSQASYLLDGMSS